MNSTGMNIGVLEVLCILTLVAVVALIVWLFKRSGSGGKECPHCAETIKAAAKVCRFCGREV